MSQDTRQIVDEWRPVAVRILGREWEQGDRALISDPHPPRRNRQGLFTDLSVGSGDFHVKARLAIHNLDRSAAAFAFSLTDFFGFEGAHEAMFVTGAFFDGAHGRKIGDPAAVIRDGEPFEFECIRKEDRLYVLIDGKTVYTQQVEIHAMGPVGFTPGRSIIHLRDFAVTGHLEPYRPPAPPVPISDVDHIEAHPLLTPMPHLQESNYAHLANGDMATATGRHVIVSSDGGETWDQREIFRDEVDMAFGSALILAPPGGGVVLVFANDREFHFSWDRGENLPRPDCRRPTYAVRSVDHGATWGEPAQLDDGYCGALNDAIITTAGTFLVAGQELLYDKGRHTTVPYRSVDGGRTWTKAAPVDMEMPRGDHAGLIEATLEQLRDGRIWLLLRSYHGHFYESFSEDDGRTWSSPAPSAIRSTGSPGLLKRLASGRLLLVWNAIPNPGFKRREELSVAFSEDEGRSWTEPLVILRNRGGRVSYPHVFEPVPGMLWLTVTQGHYRGRFREADALDPAARTVTDGWRGRLP